MHKHNAAHQLQSLLPLCLVLAVASAATAESETALSKVSLVVRDGLKDRPTAGSLYRAYPDKREYVAEVDATGKLDRMITCKDIDRFEADAASKLDRPSDPVRLVCGPTLVFQFTRMFVTIFPPDTTNPFANQLASAKAYTIYADEFAKAGKLDAAKTLSDAAMVSIAKILGDTKGMDLIYRDEKNGYDMALTLKGLNALSVKKEALGIPQATDTVSFLDAIAKQDSKMRLVEKMKCAPLTAKGRPYFCKPFPGNQALDPEENMIVLPKIQVKF